MRLQNIWWKHSFPTLDSNFCYILCIIPDTIPISPAKPQEVFIVALKLQGSYYYVLNYSVAV